MTFIIDIFKDFMTILLFSIGALAYTYFVLFIGAYLGYWYAKIVSRPKLKVRKRKKVKRVR